MTLRKIVPAALSCTLAAALATGFLFLLILESQQPGNVPAYAMPAVGFAGVAAILLCIRSLRDLSGPKAISSALGLVFLLSVAIWLVLEVTVI